jgi:hypothetical protein
MKKLSYLFLSLMILISALGSCTKVDKMDNLSPTTPQTPLTIVAVNSGGNVTCEEVAAAIIEECGNQSFTFTNTSGRIDYTGGTGGTTQDDKITWTTDGVYVNWNSTVPINVAVIVKGGNNAAIYFSGCDICTTSGTLLSAPINPKTKKPYGLSNITFCYNVCEEETCSETAFAKATEENLSHCFSEYSALVTNDNRWGWTNGPLNEGSYTFEIWAGAGQCDTDKGTKVGSLEVNYSAGQATVTFSMDSNYTMGETHLYVGNEVLPKDQKGKYTLAPGKYPVHHSLSQATTDTYTVTGLSGEIYVIAHAVVFVGCPE